MEREGDSEMGTRKREVPSLDDAGFMAYQLTMPTPPDRVSYNILPKDVKKHYVKLAIEIWREVERCI